jgi:hypothetical protein
VMPLFCSAMSTSLAGSLCNERQRQAAIVERRTTLTQSIIYALAFTDQTLPLAHHGGPCQTQAAKRAVSQDRCQKIAPAAPALQLSCLHQSALLTKILTLFSIVSRT